jgi:hypothetical protein
MKKALRKLCRLVLLGIASRMKSAIRTVSGSILVALGVLTIWSGQALAGDDSALLSVNSSSVPTDPEAQLTPEQGRLYYDRFVTGDWGGYRTLLHNWGVDFNLDYFGEAAGNISGGKDHFSGYPKAVGESWAYADQALLGVDLDFQKLIGWEGASFQPILQSAVEIISASIRILTHCNNTRKCLDEDRPGELLGCGSNRNCSTMWWNGRRD